MGEWLDESWRAEVFEGVALTGWPDGSYGLGMCMVLYSFVHETRIGEEGLIGW